jgi:hypothetical protein
MAALALPVVAQTLVYFLSTLVRLPGNLDSEWGAQIYEHAMLLLIALGSISFAKRVIRSDYGLHLPRGKSYVGAALFWGIVLGVLMTLVSWWPNIVAQQPLQGQFDLAQQNVLGWLVCKGLVEGPAEETAFRGLLVTCLLATIPGRVAFGRLELGVGGVVAAAIVALGHTIFYLAEPVYVAFSQQVLIFVSGVLFAYWFERSKSLLAPVIGHNLAGATEYALIFIMVSAWGALSG